MKETVSKEKLDVRVANLDCEHDAAAIERGLLDFAGLVRVQVYPKSAKVRLEYDPAVTEEDTLRRKLDELGFTPQKGLEMAQTPKPWRNPKVLTSLASGLLLLVGWLAERTSITELIPLVLYATAMITGGYFFGREAVEELIFEREIGIELLMSIAAVVAALLGQAAEGTMLVFLYSISEAAEGYTEEKTRAAIKALMDLAPKTALIRRDGREEEVPIEEIQVSDVLILRPGQSVATDGVIVAGSSSLNQAPVTGESLPVEKRPGDAVFAGSINGEGALEVRATKAFADNTISRIIEMVEEAQERKGRSQLFIERFGARYSPLVLLVGVLIAVLPPLFFNASWATWITRATVFIVAAAPCALVISIPITLVATLGTAARRGVLIKGGVHVEALAKIRVVALDKTGTLTRGEPIVTDVLVCHDAQSQRAISQHQVLALAAGIERRSEHPLARAIVRHAQSRDAVPLEVDDFQALPGTGAKAHFDATTVYVGSTELFQERLSVNLTCARDEIDRLQREGKTVVVVGDDQGPWGLIAIRDNLRSNAQEAIEALHTVGVQNVVMLTGDNERTAQAIAGELGIDQVYADLQPEDKLTKVRELSGLYGQVAMVGDGVNDAPALAEATVGVAMGAVGTDVALETADVALMADDLMKLTYALKLAQRNQSVVAQNLGLSAVVIGALVIGAVVGLFNLPVAVLGHEISEFIVIGSGLRMLRG